MLSTCPVSATFPVLDLKAAKQFYSTKLGLRLTAGSLKHGFLEFRAGKGTSLMFFQSEIGGRQSDNTTATFEVKNLRREMKTLRQRGVKFEEYDLPNLKTEDGVSTMGDHVMAWLKDPEGNVLALHQRK